MKPRQSWRAIPWVALLVLSACQDPPTDPTVVDTLRILAVRSEPPEAAPGDTVTFDALTADPNGDGRPITTVWAICIPNAVEGLASCDAENTTPFAFTPATTFDVPGDVLDGLSPELATTGIDLFLLFAVTADEQTEVAIKRLRVSTVTTPNINPVIQDFTFETPQTDAVRWTVLPTEDSLEEIQSVTGTAPERMRYSWFTTEGSMSPAVSLGDEVGLAATSWTHTSTPASLWVVLRDPRGGVTWLRQDVNPGNLP